VIVASLMLLGSAGDREVFIARTTQARTYSEGFAYRRKAELTAAFANRVSPVRSFFNVNGTPVMQTGAGVVAIVPMDYVYWSPGLAQLISNTGTQGQIWITGSASQLATPWLGAAGRSCPRPARVWRNSQLTSPRWQCPKARCRPASI
jgi:hypothetical protein